MFAIIGMFFVWLIGLYLSYTAPLILTMRFDRHGDLGAVAAGDVLGRVICGMYVGLTALYFIVT